MASGYTRIPLSDPEIILDKPREAAFTYGAANSVESTRNKMYKSIYDFRGTKLPEEVKPPPSNPLLLCFTYFLTFLCYLGFMITIPISGWFCLRTVHNYERLVVFRLGRLSGTKGPGLVLILPCIDRIVKIDLRMKAFSVPPQKILTNDNAAIEGGADVYYRVAEPIKCVTGVQDLDNSIRVLSQTVLQNHLNKQTLSDIETNRPAMGFTLQDKINTQTKMWGVEVSRIDLSQIKVIQGPTGGQSNQAQNLLNMIAPGLLPAGTTPLPQFPGGQNLMPQVAAPQQSAGHQFLGSLLGGMAPVQPAPGGSSVPAIMPVTQTAGPRLTVASPQDLVDKVRPHLGPELVREFGLVYKFLVSGPNGGVFYLDLKHGDGDVGTGEPSTLPDATLTLSEGDMGLILAGELSAFSAYMSGELSVVGDVHGAMRLGQLIDRIK